ncbi:MAG TPA: hypothetical protein VEA69_16050 [Tepidisphaeraceae bacterium]|nr:hypothetical protein [Tepidisphaeraceae bacterium]
MTPTPGPYRVDRVETPQGPHWRLAGPGLPPSKAYHGDEFRDKLAEIAHLMNFAYDQGRGVEAPTTSTSVQRHK